MSTPITLLKANSGHLSPHGEVCCNQRFNVESPGIGSGARAFCAKCGAEVTIVGSKTITSALHKCE
jgi:uncharacterized paraquat-inducible protein A